MNPLRFHRSRQGSIFYFHYLSGEEFILGKQWDGEIDTEPEGDERILHRSILEQSDRAVYFGLAWELTEDLTRLVIAPSRHGGYHIEPLKKVRWSYQADSEGQDDSFGREGEFIRTNGERVYPLRNLADLLAVYAGAWGDAATNLNLVGLGENRVGAFIAQLNEPKQVQMENVLDVGDVYFNITMGEDLGYSDSLFVASKGISKTESSIAYVRQTRELKSLRKSWTPLETRENTSIASGN